MCFSESASFSASGLLAIMSIFSLKAARKLPKYLPLALIPLFFALQQFSEGLQWHFFNAGTPSTYAKFVYSFFAFAWWPFWIPFALYFAEEEATRKTAFGVLALLGLILAGNNFYHVINHPVQAAVVEKSIQYTTGISVNTVWPYFFLTIIPWFLSSLKGTTILGIIVAISAFAASYFYYDAFTSVWCFFSALFSALVIIILRIQKRI